MGGNKGVTSPWLSVTPHLSPSDYLRQLVNHGYQIFGYFSSIIKVGVNLLYFDHKSQWISLYYSGNYSHLSSR